MAVGPRCRPAREERHHQVLLRGSRAPGQGLGDPRFLGVVAVPGPRRLFGVAQRAAVDDRMSARKRGVSPEARERAKVAGARVG
ncbi:UNVERIFIED_CONTAM: hypothetical protein RKD50_006703 [Streptomyces canus]